MANVKTESEMLTLLKAHYLDRRGNGDEYAFLPHVRDKAGFDAARTLDLLVIGLWPSRGLPFIGHEIKCSRADWLTELRNPAKADVFHEVIDAMYLVVADPEIVQEGELPPTWGLMHPQTYKYRGEVRERLKVAKRVSFAVEMKNGPSAGVHRTQLAERIFSRSFVAALLKNATKIGNATPEEIKQAVERERELQKKTHDWSVNNLKERLSELEDIVGRFEKESGVKLNRWSGDRQVDKIGRSLRLVLANVDAPAEAERDLRRVAEQARRVANQADKALLALKTEEGKDD